MTMSERDFHLSLELYVVERLGQKFYALLGNDLDLYCTAK
jgi:hypothetical protein